MRSNSCWEGLSELLREEEPTRTIVMIVGWLVVKVDLIDIEEAIVEASTECWG